MFLTVHSASGLLIGQYFKSPILALLSGLVLHYVFDIIPHGDTKAPKKYHNVVYMTLAGIWDLAMMVSYLLIFMLAENKFLSLSQITAISGAILPDALIFLYFIKPQNKFLYQAKKIHQFIHGLISNKFEFNFSTGIILQVLIFILLLSLI